MKFNQWTLALAAAGVVSLGSVAQAEEAQHPVVTALSSTTLSGYVDTSAIWQFGTGKISTGRSYDAADKQDGFNLNVVGLRLEKPLDENPWAAGYTTDLLFGPDANIYGTQTAAAGDFAVKQAYVTLRAPVGNGLDFQLGVFDSIIGYEAFESYKNPNYSRSYGYFLEPHAHTGVLVRYSFTDWLSMAGGVANTTDPQAVSFPAINARPQDRNGFVAESQKTYMGLIRLTAPESFGFLKGASLYGGAVNGLPSTAAVTGTDMTSYYAGLSVPTPMEGLSVGACYDYLGNTRDVNDQPSSGYANAMAGYITYKATEKLQLNNRIEYATSSDGIFYNRAVDAAGNSFPGNNALLGETFTVQYQLWANVLTRAEFRWDHDLTNQPDGPPPAGYAGAFGTGLLNAYSLSLNVVYQF